MILGSIRRILKEDLAKAGETPAWLDIFLQPLNQFIDTISQALRNNLTFKDNFYSKVTTQNFTHAVELSISTDGNNKILGVLPVLAVKSTDSAAATKNMITGCAVNLKGNGQVGVTINFGGGAGIKADVTLVILFG